MTTFVDVRYKCIDNEYIFTGIIILQKESYDFVHAEVRNHRSISTKAKL